VATELVVIAMAKTASRSRPRPSSNGVTRGIHADEETLRQVVRTEVQAMVPELMAQTLVKLGMKVSEEDDIIETQKDMAYLRSWRKAVQAGSGRAGLAMVSLAILGVVAAVLASIGIKLPSFAIPTQ